MQRISTSFEINYSPLPTPAQGNGNNLDNANGIDDRGPPSEELMSHHLALQSQKSRAQAEAPRAQMEASKKRVREEAITEGFRDA